MPTGFEWSGPSVRDLRPTTLRRSRLQAIAGGAARRPSATKRRRRR